MFLSFLSISSRCTTRLYARRTKLLYLELAFVHTYVRPVAYEFSMRASTHDRNYGNWLRRAARRNISKYHDGVHCAVGGLTESTGRDHTGYHLPFPRHYVGRKCGTAFHGRLLKWFYRRLKLRVASFSWSQSWRFALDNDTFHRVLAGSKIRSEILKI